MQKARTMIPLLLISLLVIFADQLLKWVMLAVLVYGSSISVINGFFSLTLVYNTGAAFGIMRGWTHLFLVLPIVTAAIILFIYIKSRQKEKLLLPLALLLGGTLGNFIDRVKYGYVVDFFDLFFRSYHWPAFNIADACICFGVFLLFFNMIKGKELLI